MQTNASIPGDLKAARPWYAHLWPWLLLIGPVAVIVAGIHTTWLAYSSQDALVVDDYYKQGKAINQDLRRDLVAANMKVQVDMGYDAVHGRLDGTIHALDASKAGAIIVRLVHPTQPDKDMRLELHADQYGNFSGDLPMLELGRWQVQVENEARDWRLRGVWAWPQQTKIELRPDTELLRNE